MQSSAPYPGVYIREVPSRVRTITGVGTSTVAFVGIARSGPVDEPVTIHSFAEYEREFGGLWYPSGMSYAVSQFFLNGGAEAVVVRIAPDNAYKGIVYMNWSTGDEVPSFEAVSPGTWYDSVYVTMDQRPGAPADLFNFKFQQYAQLLSANLNAELLRSEVYLDVSFKSTSPRYIGTVLELESKLARYIGPPTDNTSDNIDSVGNRETGLDGTLSTATVVGAGFEAAQRGIYALEKISAFNILCIPPITRAADGVSWADVPNAVWAEAAAYATRRRAILLVDPPSAWTKANATGNLSDLGAPSANAALFFPRLYLADPLRKNMADTFAPSGAVAGAIARTDAERGFWKAPAGLDARLVGVDRPVIPLTDAETGELNPLGVNVIRTVPAAGTVIWGSRTMVGADRLASEWKYLPVRRTALFIEESLYRGTQWVVFESNDEPLWAQIRLNVGAFMHELFRQGAFQGATPAEAYYVKCDSTTTTQNDINQGVVNILVGFAPLKPAEFVVIKIQQMMGQIAS